MKLNNILKSFIRNLLDSKSKPGFLLVSLLITIFGILYTLEKSPNTGFIVVGFILFVLILFTIFIFYLSYFSDVRISNNIDKEHYDYLILDSTLKWKILTSDGKDAYLEKQRKIRFLEKGVSTIREYIWGDIYSPNNKPKKEDFQINIGEVIDIYQEGGMWVILIGLDRSYSLFEEIDYKYRRRIKNGFISNHEWVEYKSYTNTDKENLIVEIPSSRPINNVNARYRYGDFVLNINTGNNNFSIASNNDTQIISWILDKPKARSSFFIEWDW